MNKVLIAIDGRRASKSVLATYYSLLNRPDVVILLHVQKLEGGSLMIDMLGEAELSTLRDAVQDTEHKEKLDREAMRIIEYYKHEIEEVGHVAVKTIVREGIPADEILKVAQDESVDLILMGSSKSRGLGRLITGSVAKEVQKRSKVPVLLAKRIQMCEEPYSWRDAYAAISVTTAVILGMFLFSFILQKSQFLHH